MHFVKAPHSFSAKDYIQDCFRVMFICPIPAVLIKAISSDFWCNAYLHRSTEARAVIEPFNLACL